MKISPQQKKLAIAGAGVVVVVFALIARSKSAASDTTGLDTTGTTAADPGPSTFADNGAGFGQLSTAIADGLGSVSTGFDSLTSSIDTNEGGLADQITTLSDRIDQLANAGITPAAAPMQAPPAQLAATGQPAARSMVAGQPVHLDSHGADSGLHFITVDRGGVATRLYETAPGKGNFGATQASVVSLGTPAPAALPSFKSIIAKTAPNSPVKPQSHEAAAAAKVAATVKSTAKTQAKQQKKSKK